MNHTRKDIVMMAAIGGLLAFAVFNFVFKPQRNDLSSARSEVSAVEEKISKLQADLAAPVETPPEVADDTSARAIPQDPALTQLLRQLDDTADQSHVTLETLTPSELEANPNGPGGSMVLEITASGAHDANQAFVAGLKDLERLLVVERIAVILPPPLVDQATPPEQLQLTVRVFALRAPAEPVEPVTPTSGP